MNGSEWLLATWVIAVCITLIVVALIEASKKLDADIARALSPVEGLTGWDAALAFETHVTTAIEVTR